MNKIKKLLELCEIDENEKEETDDVKKYIQNILENDKKNQIVQKINLSTIYHNLKSCDHHDLVRIDQILTRKANRENTLVQWGSLVLDCKWSY